MGRASLLLAATVLGSSVSFAAKLSPALAEKIGSSNNEPVQVIVIYRGGQFAKTPRSAS
ncbi:MAG: hypothetical protein HY548_09495, partial [Elusimicrobia bacterium]|nr:hypothetical protein [Elusimicrobiota bacterium]